jgi:hypothetical protein
MAKMARILSLALCGLCLSGCISVNQGGRPLGSIVQTQTMPEPGQWCRVTYPETRRGLERHQSIVTGKVESIDEDGIHLSEASGVQMVGVPIAEKVPVVRRLFKNTGVGYEGDRVVRLDGTEQVDIISEQEGRQSGRPAVGREQNVAQQLVSAVPGRR